MSARPNVPVAQDFDLVQSKALPYKDQEVPQRPTWALGICRRVEERHIAITLWRVVKEPIFELPQRAYLPAIREFISTFGFIRFSLLDLYLLSQEESMLSSVYAVSPSSDSVDEGRTLVGSQML
jgi:hypothetical protein